MDQGNGKRHMSSLSRGFSLLELVIVVVILGLVAAIAIPRMSRGSQGAAEAALAKNLATLRNALERYRAEHDGQAPPKDEVQEALCYYSNSVGDSFSATKDTTHYLGPYLGSPPPLPVGDKKGSVTIAKVGSGSVGWVYDEGAATITANCEADEIDTSGMPYNQY